MRYPNYQSISGDQSSSLSPGKRLLSRITWKAVVLYGAAAFYVVVFFTGGRPHTSTRSDTVITIAVFFASIMLHTLLTLRDRRVRARRLQMGSEPSGKRRAPFSDWLLGILVVILTAAYFAGTFFTSNPVIAEVARSFAAGNVIALLVNSANKRWHDDPASEPAPYRDGQGNLAPYRDGQGNYD